MKLPLSDRHRHLATIAGAILTVGIFASVLPSCGGDKSRFPEAQAGKVIEFFDPAKADIGFDPERHYLSAAAMGRDGTLYIGVADRKNKDGGQNLDHGRLFAVPKSGKPKAISDGTVSALAVSGDGTVYIASSGLAGSTLSFFRDGKEKHIVDYSDRQGGPTPTSPGVDRTLRGLAIDDELGDIYVADAYKIDRVDRLGRLAQIAGARRKDDEPKPAVGEATGLAGQQFDSISALAYAPDDDTLYVGDGGHLRAIHPQKPDSGLMIVPLELPDGSYEGGFARRGIAYDAASKTIFGITKGDDAIVVLGRQKEPKIPVDKSVLEDVVRMTVGGDGNLYLSGGRRVYVFAPPAA